jgi:hypothetical protein
VQQEDPTDPKKNIVVEENIIRIPRSLGLTGKAIES